MQSEPTLPAQGRRCGMCGEHAEPAARFCGGCGRPLTDETPPSSEPAGGPGVLPPTEGAPFVPPAPADADPPTLDDPPTLAGGAAPPGPQEPGTLDGEVAGPPPATGDPESPSPAPEAGAWGLERFRLAGELGRGASSTVYLAYDAVLARDVALKVEDLTGADREGELRRLEQEAATLAALPHPNIVQVLDHGRAEGRTWLATEYVTGASLRQLLEHAGTLRAPQAAGVLSGALLGLGEAHRHGVVHGDLKPENILVTPDGASKLADFGSSVGRSGAGGGSSPQYASPQLAASGTPDVASDLYAMGVVLYESLAGRPPFRAHPEVVAHQHLTADPPPIPGIPPPVAAVVASVLAKEPADRPATADDFRERLEAAIAEADGPRWRERAAIGALAAAVGAELGAVIAPAVASSGAGHIAGPHTTTGTTAAHEAGMSSPAAAPHAGVHGGAATSAPPPGAGLPGPGGRSGAAPAPSLGRRLITAAVSHKLAVAGVAAVLGAGAGLGAAVTGSSSPSSSSSPTGPISSSSPGAPAPTTPRPPPPGGSSGGRSDSGAGPGSGSIPDAAGGSWSMPKTVESGTPIGAGLAMVTSLVAVSCPSPQFCAAIDGNGDVVTYNGQQWSRPTPIDPNLSGATRTAKVLSCPTADFCAVGDSQGDVVTLAGSSWSSPVQVNADGPITALACSSSSACVAGSNDGNIFTYDGHGWSPADQVDTQTADPGPPSINALTCPTASFCLAVDDQGFAMTDNDGSWSAPTPVQSGASSGTGYLEAVSCASPSYCLALGGSDGAYTYDGSSWSGPISSAPGTIVSFGTVSCPSAGWCKAAEPGAGVVSLSGATWHPPSMLGEQPGLETVDWTDVSCPMTTFCVAVDSQGKFSRFRA